MQLHFFIFTDGHLFDKEAILEYIISKKNEISRKIKEYERQCKKEQVSNDNDYSIIIPYIFVQ